MKNHSFALFNKITFLAISTIFIFSCSTNSIKSLREAYNIVLENDALSGSSFSISEDYSKVVFKSEQFSEHSNNINQKFLNLQMFMLMCGFSFSDFELLKESSKIDSEGAIKKTYKCEWISSVIEGVTALFY